MVNTFPTYKILKFIGLLLFTIASSFYVYSQEPDDDDEINLLLDELFFNEEEFIEDILASVNKRSYVYTNVLFNTNTYFSGRDSGIDQFSLIPQVSYNHVSGFHLSISGIYYETFSPNWDFTNLSLGYYNTIGNKNLVHYNTGYTRYFYNDDWDIFTNSVDASIGIRNKNRSLGSNIAVSYLFGGDQSLQIASSTFGKIRLVKNKNYQILFRPNLQFVLAKQTIAIEELNNQGSGDTAELIDYDIFDLLNTQINIPLSISTKAWDIGLGYTVNLPNAVATESELNTTSYFKISVGYLIDLK